MLIFSGSNSYLGLTMAGGTLNINADAALGSTSGGLTFSGNSTLQAGADGIVLDPARNLTINAGATATLDTQNYNMTVAGAVSGSGGLAKLGAGMLTLSASNSYCGGTQITAGTLQVGNAAALGIGSLTANGGLLDLNAHPLGVGSLSGIAGTITDNGSYTGVVTTLTVNQTSPTTFSGTIVDGINPLGLSKTGPGMLTLSSANGYSGGTTVSAGTLQIAAAGTFGTGSGSLGINGGVVDLGGTSQSVSTLGLAGGAIAATGGTLTVSADYTNSGFGSGNAFNAHAGVGAGVAIDAAGSGLSESVVDHGTANPTSLAFGNIRTGRKARTSTSSGPAAAAPRSAAR